LYLVFLGSLNNISIGLDLTNFTFIPLFPLG
jgi:hypothetical protein